MKLRSKLVCKFIIATAFLSSALMNPITAYSSKLPPDTVTVKEPVAPKPTPAAQTTGIPHTVPVIMSLRHLVHLHPMSPIESNWHCLPLVMPRLLPHL